MSSRTTLLELFVPVLLFRLGLQDKSISTDYLSSKLKDVHDTMTLKLGEDKMKALSNAFNANSTLSTIVDLCKTGLEEVMKDGKIDANDSPVFLRTVRKICNNITASTKKTINFSIEATELVDLCGFFLKALIIALIQNESEQLLAIALTDSALELINFRVDGKKLNCSCLCF